MSAIHVACRYGHELRHGDELANAFGDRDVYHHVDPECDRHAIGHTHLDGCVTTDLPSCRLTEARF